MSGWLKTLNVLFAVSALSAQQNAPELQILVIGGEGSINNVKQRTAREPVIEVRDRNNRPIAGALVLFEAPKEGASGTFVGGSPALRVTTDAQGRAIGRGFHANRTEGSFTVQVSVAFQSLSARTEIRMQNTGAATSGRLTNTAGHGKLIGIAVAVGAAAAAGATYAATRGGSSTPAAVPTTISAGVGSVAGRP